MKVKFRLQVHVHVYSYNHIDTYVHFMIYSLSGNAISINVTGLKRFQNSVSEWTITMHNDKSRLYIQRQDVCVFQQAPHDFEWCEYSLLDNQEFGDAV